MFLLVVFSIARPRNNFLRIIYRSRKIASAMGRAVDSDMYRDRFFFSFFLHRLITSRGILRDVSLSPPPLSRKGDNSLETFFYLKMRRHSTIRRVRLQLFINALLIA